MGARTFPLCFGLCKGVESSCLETEPAAGLGCLLCFASSQYWWEERNHRRRAGISALSSRWGKEAVSITQSQSQPRKESLGWNRSPHSERCPLSLTSELGDLHKIDSADLIRTGTGFTPLIPLHSADKHRSWVHTPDYIAVYTKPTCNHGGYKL